MMMRLLFRPLAWLPLGLLPASRQPDKHPRYIAWHPRRFQIHLQAGPRHWSSQAAAEQADARLTCPAASARPPTRAVVAAPQAYGTITTIPAARCQT